MLVAMVHRERLRITPCRRYSINWNFFQALPTAKTKATVVCEISEDENETAAAFGSLCNNILSYATTDTLIA